MTRKHTYAARCNVLNKVGLIRQTLEKVMPVSEVDVVIDTIHNALEA